MIYTYQYDIYLCTYYRPTCDAIKYCQDNLECYGMPYRNLRGQFINGHLYYGLVTRMYKRPSLEPNFPFWPKINWNKYSRSSVAPSVFSVNFVTRNVNLLLPSKHYFRLEWLRWRQISFKLRHYANRFMWKLLLVEKWHANCCIFRIILSFVSLSLIIPCTMAMELKALMHAKLHNENFVWNLTKKFGLSEFYCRFYIYIYIYICLFYL